MADVVSSYEAAQILQCSSDNVRRLAREGRLRTVISTRAGRLFSKGEVESLAAERRLRQSVGVVPSDSDDSAPSLSPSRTARPTQ